MAVEGHIATGDTISGYEIEELVGRGGMGEIYRARDPRLDRRVALKLLAERFSEDAEFRERLLRESRIAASLDHPNVIPVYEAGETDDRLFIAMRFVEGPDLEALLRSDGPLEPARAIAIASQVADALDAAHARGLVHRDVKPSNVLLDRQDRREHVYLADFGLTQSVSDRGPTDGHLVGTVDYVAPEQIRGDDVDGRADVYGLGCVLFKALTGSVPFSGVSDVAVIDAHLETPPPRASERRDTLPEALDDVLARAMAKEPEDRQPTCAALVGEARKALGLDARPRTSRVLLAAAAAAVVALIAAAVGAVLVLREDTASASPGGAMVRIDATTGKVLSTTPTGSTPTQVAVESGQVWFATTDTIWRSILPSAHPSRSRRSATSTTSSGSAATCTSRVTARSCSRASSSRTTRASAPEPTASQFSPAAWRPRRHSACGWPGARTSCSSGSSPNRLDEGASRAVAVPRTDDSGELSSVSLRDDDRRGVDLGSRRCLGSACCSASRPTATSPPS